jgi:hypothetical protein
MRTANVVRMPNPPSRPRDLVEPPIGTRIADVIEARAALVAWCARCGNKTAIDIRLQFARVNDLMRLDDVQRKLKCSFCGENRNAAGHRERHGRLLVHSADCERIPRYR